MLLPLGADPSALGHRVLADEYVGEPGRDDLGDPGEGGLDQTASPASTRAMTVRSPNSSVRDDET